MSAFQEPTMKRSVQLDRDHPPKIMIQSTLEDTDVMPTTNKSPESVLTLKKTKSSLSPKILHFE